MSPPSTFPGADVAAPSHDDSQWGTVEVPPFFRKGAAPASPLGGPATSPGRRPGPARPRAGREWRFLIAGLLLGDLLALAVATHIAGYVLLDELLLPPTAYGSVAQQVGVVALYTALFWAIGWRAGIYRRDNLLGGPIEYERVFRVSLYTAVAERVASYLLRMPPLPRAWWVAELVAAIFCVFLIRFTIRRIAYQLRRRGLFTTRILIAGADDQGITIGRQLLWARGSGFEVVGFLDDYVSVGSWVTMGDRQNPGRVGDAAAGDERLRVLGSSAELARVAAEHRVQEVIVIPHAISWEGLQTIVAGQTGGNDGLKVHLSAGLYDTVTANMIPTQRALVPLLTLGSKRLIGLDALLKTAFERTVAALLFLCTWPVLWGLVLAGWRRGIRPALEWRTVVGQGGRVVRLPLLSKAITRHVLLRGLPALLGVLDGRLSLVGPRPIAQEEATKYGQWAPLLMAMRPGLTGHWRLLPGKATLEDAAAWDLWYLRNYSIWTDLFLVLHTARASIRSGNRPGPGALQRWEPEPELPARERVQVGA